MATKKEALGAEGATVMVRLLCARSGDGWTDNPGDVVPVDAEEAARLIAIGAAEAADAADPADAG